jgi:hypothetical protein
MCREDRNNDTAVTRSPDLVTRPTAGLPALLECYRDGRTTVNAMSRSGDHDITGARSSLLDTGGFGRI